MSSGSRVNTATTNSTPMITTARPLARYPAMPSAVNERRARGGSSTSLRKDRVTPLAIIATPMTAMTTPASTRSAEPHQLCSSSALTDSVVSSPSAVPPRA